MEKFTSEQKAAMDIRRACRHFAMIYFHFCKTLVESFGEERAYELARESVFNLSLERTDLNRQKAEAAGAELNLESFAKFNDLPISAWSEWTPEMGGVRCAYAEQWLTYYDEYPWFKRFAALYCEVIDTTNIENFSGTLSHRIVKSLVLGDDHCESEYFESDAVKNGEYTYGKR